MPCNLYWCSLYFVLIFFLNCYCNRLTFMCGSFWLCLKMPGNRGGWEGGVWPCTINQPKMPDTDYSLAQWQQLFYSLLIPRVVCVFKRVCGACRYFCLIWQCVCAKNRPLSTLQNPDNKAQTWTNNKYLRLSLFLLKHNQKKVSHHPNYLRSVSLQSTHALLLSSILT